MLKGYKYIKGYLKMKAKGQHIERFLNMAILDKIHIWDIKRIDGNTVTFFVSFEGFKLMGKNCRKSNTKMKIIKKMGLPILIKKSNKRKTFLLCGLVTLLLLFVSSSFIWEIEINDQEFISKDLIIQKLKENNLFVGSLRKTIDNNAISNALISTYEEIMWANVELKGTKLKVTLVPRMIKPAVISKDVPANIVAKKDGSITRIIAENGDKMVKIGDLVFKDQILISGMIPSPIVGTRYLHSIGEVTATTWTEKTYEKKLYAYQKEYTGNNIIKREINIPFLKIPLYFNNKIDYVNFDTLTEEKNVLFANYTKKTSNEYHLKKEVVPKEKVVEDTVLEFEAELKNEGITNIISQQVNYNEIDNETIKITILVETEENIGVEKEIVQ